MRNYAPFYVNADCAVCFSIAFFYVRLAALEITADQRSMIARILSLIGWSFPPPIKMIGKYFPDNNDSFSI